MESGVQSPTVSRHFCGLDADCVVGGGDATTTPAVPPPPPPSSSPAPPSSSPAPEWGLLPLCVIPVWIVVGNALVLLALLLQRHLQNMSNRVIASLAVTDFLLALVVVPLSIYQLVSSRPYTSVLSVMIIFIHHEW